MARYLKSFQNDAAIQEAVDNKSLGKPYVALDDQLHRIDWNGKEETDYSKMYLTIEALEDGELELKSSSAYYSINGGEWTLGATINVSNGDKIRFKSNNLVSTPFSGNTLTFNVCGNIESLEYGDNFVGQTSNNVAFTGLFRGCTGLVDASNLVLPATTLVRKCYEYMFAWCTSLTTAPELPATTLADRCYYGMFHSCTSLTTAPALPATTLVNQCYTSMFKDCTSLTTAPELPAATLVNNVCYGGMFNGCTNLNYIKCLATNPGSYTSSWLQGVSPTGTFVRAEGVLWPTGDSGIPSGWTVIEE